MAFPTTSVLTNFTGADEAPLSEGGNWAGPIRTTANQARRQANAFANPTSGGSTGESYWNAASFGPDSEVYATASVLLNTDTHFLGLCSRIQTPNTSTASFYALEIVRTNSTTYTPTVYRVINAAFTSLATLATFNPSAGELWGLEVSGTGANVTLRMFRNTGGGWAQNGTDTVDSNAARIVASGKLGAYIGGAVNEVCRLDDFGGGTIVVPPAAVPSLTLLGVGT